MPVVPAVATNATAIVIGRYIVSELEGAVNFPPWLLANSYPIGPVSAGTGGHYFISGSVVPRIIVCRTFVGGGNAH